MPFRITGLLLCLFLTACAQTPKKETFDDKSSKLPSEVTIKDCNMFITSGNLTLSTDGRLSSNAIRFKIVSEYALVNPPQVMLNIKQDVIVTMEGVGRAFGFDVPYNKKIVSYLYNKNAYLIARYQPVKSATEYKAYFKTRSILDGISYLSKACHA